MRKMRHAQLLVVLAGLAFSGCSSDATKPETAVVQSALTANGVDVSLALTSDWTSGYCASVTLKNNSSTSVSNWSVVVQLNQSTVSQIWGATSTTSGTQLTATAVFYDQTITAGTSVSFGFCGTATGTTYRPTLVSANITGGGQSNGTGGASATGGSKSTGGSLATGGSKSTGGSLATGGSKSTGGTPATGGSNTTGGTMATGGSKATGGSIGSSCGAGTSTSNDVVVNLSSAQQKISGFGVSTAWGSTMSTADADLLWSTTTGAGLSLHRIRIDTTGTGTSETNIAKLAVARGVTVWATPWTPPAADKDNNNTVMGHLSNGQDFANKLATFVKNMKNNGVPIYAVSAQNEPDANVTYESCSYTGATLASFVGSYMGAAVKAAGAKVMAPETQNWCGFPSYFSALQSNTAAWGYVDIVATHEYGCSPSAYPAIQQAGKEFWETEIYDTSTTDQSITSGLRVAKLIHDAFTIANMNAWHYWWTYATDNGGLFDSSSSPAKPTKRLYVEGNYARFIRPGYQRVSTSGAVPSNVWLSAYKNPTDGTIVVVATNNTSSATNLSVFISGAAPCTMTPYVTSSSDNLASKSPVPVSGSRFTFSLGAQSVTTFVGKP